MTPLIPQYCSKIVNRTTEQAYSAAHQPFKAEPTACRSAEPVCHSEERYSKFRIKGRALKKAGTEGLLLSESVISLAQSKTLTRLRKKTVEMEKSLVPIEFKQASDYAEPWEDGLRAEYLAQEQERKKNVENIFNMELV
jgi:hypothetical protein